MAAEIFFPVEPLTLARELILEDSLTAIQCQLIGSYFDDLKDGRAHACTDTVRFASQGIRELYDLTGQQSAPVEIHYHLS